MAKKICPAGTHRKRRGRRIVCATNGLHGTRRRRRKH